VLTALGVLHMLPVLQWLGDAYSFYWPLLAVEASNFFPLVLWLTRQPLIVCSQISLWYHMTGCLL